MTERLDARDRISDAQIDCARTGAPENQSQPLVAVVLVNWNGSQDTIECLDSLAKTTYQNKVVIVVDNASSDSQASSLAEHAGIVLIQNSTNVGFAAACNQAAKRAIEMGADYVLLLNNDTVVDPGFLEALLQAFAQTEDAGIASSVVYRFDRPTEVWSAGLTFDWWLGGAQHIVTPNHLLSCVDYACGCVLMAPASLIRRIGLFDERYFAYFEDLDLSLRVRSAGYQIVIVPQSKVWHRVSRSTERRPGLQGYYSTRAGFLFMSRHARWYHWPSFTLAWLRYHIITPIKTLLRTGRAESLTGAGLALRGVADFLQGRFSELRR